MSTRRLDELRAQAQYARERYQLYKAKAYGQRSTSQARMRELERAYEGAQARLRAAEAEERRARSTDDRPPGPGRRPPRRARQTRGAAEGRDTKREEPSASPRARPAA
jgi:hypothetical protein